MIKKCLLACLLMFTFPTMSAFAADSSQPTSAQEEGIEITVNINTASAEEIATLLNGIGIKKAQAIVEYREQHGAFKTQKDLTNVKGIGAATVSKNGSRILL